MQPADETSSTGTTAAVDSSTSAPSDLDTTAGEDPSTSSSSSGEPADPPPPPLPWTDDCTYINSDLSRLNERLECAGVTVPLDHDDPEGESITIAAYKIPTTMAPRRGQFWLLAGGPGSSGLSFLSNAELTDALNDAGWDVLVPSHRGTLSPPLDCDNPDFSSCRDGLEDSWGDGLRHFNSTQAGHDIAVLAEREQQDLDDAIVVYGVSYGTMWAMHYGSLHPEQADALVLDSVLPSEVDVLTQEAQQQVSVEEILQRCVDDPLCGPTLPYASGTEFSNAVTAAITDGECGPQDPGTWQQTDYRTELGTLLNGGSRDYVPLMAALLAACTPETSEIYEMALPGLFSASFAMAPPSPGPLLELPRYDVDSDLFFYRALQYVVMGTTVLRNETDPTPITEEAEGNLVGLGFANLFHTVHDVWTTLPDVDPLPPYPTELPTLILSGAFDLQTPLGWAIDTAADFGPDAQHFLVFDSARHGVATSGVTFDDQPCARDIMLAFSADPLAKLDISCMDDTPPVDTTLQRPDLQQTSAEVFGIDDPWTLVP